MRLAAVKLQCVICDNVLFLMQALLDLDQHFRAKDSRSS